MEEVNQEFDMQGRRTLMHWALALVVLGVAWRTLRYFMQFPVWGDEAFLSLNFLDRGYHDLTRPLRFWQVAPVLFLWSELTAYRLLGASELALRLLPYLAGLGSLALFWKAARAALSPLASTLAIGLLAISYYPVRHCCEIKPYGFDLLFSLALLSPAICWIRRPGNLGPLLFLTFIVPLALGASYPVVFVAGGVSLALLPSIWRQAAWRGKALFASYNLLMLAAFLCYYLLAGSGQFVATGGTENPHWSDWFPPREPLALARWLFSVHAGNMMAYPLGAANGGSTLTLILCLAGVWHLWRSRDRELLILCLAPFGLTFVAAMMHRYPYGGSARVAQHLAPSICLLAGAGTAALIAWVGRARTECPRPGLAAIMVLALIGVVGIGRDLLKPYKTDGVHEARQMVHDLFASAGPDDQIVILNHLDDPRVNPTFEWYFRQQESRVSWGGRIDWKRLAATQGRVWCLSFDYAPSKLECLDSVLAQGKPALILSRHVDRTVSAERSDKPIEHVGFFCLVCTGPEDKSEPRP